MQCSHYDKPQPGQSWSAAHCPEEATVWLITPAGTRCPGGHLCQRHADEPIAEYAAKLGQQWTAEPIDWLGNPITPEAG